MTLLESLVAATPADPLPLSDLIMAKADQGELLRRWGKTSEREQRCSLPWPCARNCRALEPGRPEALRGEAYVLICWSPLLLDLGLESEALDSNSKVFKLAKQLDANNGQSRDPLMTLIAHCQAGAALRELGNGAGSAETCR